MNQPNQPTPKSAEEVLNDILKRRATPIVLHGQRFYKESSVMSALKEASQFVRYVPDEEIYAMFPFLGGNITIMNIERRNGAKAMRDMIFGGVKP